MIRTALLAAVLSCPLAAQPHERQYRWSVAAVVAASTADAASSWRGYEANPLLRGPDGRFSQRGLGIKASMTAGSLLAQRLVLRRHPHRRKLAAAINWTTAAVLSGIAARNWRIGR